MIDGLYFILKIWFFLLLISPQKEADVCCASASFWFMVLDKWGCGRFLGLTNMPIQDVYDSLLDLDN